MTDRIRQAVVLAGGRGTRLGTLTAETPKPLLGVGGRPFIEWVVANLERQGVEDVVLTTGYRAEAFEEWLDGYDGAASVSTFVETEPLDTGGALTLFGDRLDESFFVLNGDTMFDAPLGELAELLAVPDAAMSIALRGVEDVGRYGRVTLDGTRVSAFAEKATRGAGLINGGVYAVHRSALAGRSAPLSIERTLVPELVAQGRVRGRPCDGYFIDIGLPETLARAQAEVPAWWAGVSTEAGVDP